MGCHQIEERSFKIRGKTFPVCARCTGILAGTFIALITFCFIKVPVPLLSVFLIPMIFDGLIQHFTSYESTNTRRFITGLLFGYSIVILFIMSLVFVFNEGRNIGEVIKKSL